MKRIKTYVPVILEIFDEDSYELQLMENSVSTEIDHLESMAHDAYMNGEYELLDDDEENL